MSKTTTYFNQMEKLTGKLGRSIKSLRKQKGLTQSELAQKLGCTQELIVQYEKGTTTPSAERIPMLADIFEVTTDELYGRTATPASKPKSPKLWKKFEQLETLPASEKRSVFHTIDGLLARKKQAIDTKTKASPSSP